ncbi:MAG: hypothetical protein PHC32_01090 [Candidatus Izemoplasmatales bacterium]|nr:hypothetical protein [Candidatus Izemoplasmatales bacterium]MDD3864908.1 hypothetical protein [Candidatus Izemoplasmatales bacterium]
MNELAEKYWPTFKLLLLPYLLLLFLLIWPIDYTIYCPGGLADVSDTVSIDYDDSNSPAGSFSTTYIMSVKRPSFFQFMVAYFLDVTETYTLSASDKTHTNAESYQISQLQKTTSVQVAIVAAYQAINAVKPEITVVEVIKTLVSDKASYLSYYDQIEYGDEFISMVGDNGLVLPFNAEPGDSECDNDADNDGIIDTACSLSDAIAINTRLAPSYAFTFRHADGENYTLVLTKNTDTNAFGLSLTMYHLLDENGTDPDFVALPSNIGGPSGGLMTALYIYDSLASGDLTHGMKIAGTGTINYDGSVGYIGGVKQKIATAYFFGADIFFIPYLADTSNDNYIEALAACEELGINPDGWLIGVQTLQDTITYLEGLGE